MITYSKLGAKIWKLVDYFEPTVIRELKSEDFEALDREITEWYESVPEEVRISNLNTGIPLPSTPSYNLERLQIWTRLRLNQVRCEVPLQEAVGIPRRYANIGFAERFESGS